MSLQQGSIIWAEVPDSRGVNPKIRPLVVITATKDINAVSPVAAVAISTRISSPQPPTEITLPWHPNKHPTTGLYEPCVAVCSWIVSVHQSNIKTILGPISRQLAESIIRSVRVALDASKAKSDKPT